MGEVQATGTLVVAVPAAPPYFSMRSGRPEGLIAGIAGEIAAALGVEVRYVVMPRTELIDAPDSGDVAISFPLAPITERAVRRHAFTDPYLVSHQRILVPGGTGGIAGDGRICTIEGEAVVSVTETHPDLREVTATASRCLRMLRSSKVDMLSGFDVDLLPLVAASRDGSRYAIVGDQLSTAGIGAIVEAGNTGWAEFIGEEILEAVENGDWTELYERTVRPVMGEATPPRPPTLTVEEAAALFPAE